jgi:nicotinamide-nucleotide amidase
MVMTSHNQSLEDLVKKLSEVLVERKIKLTTAESCTGGGIAQVLTDMPGSSAWFERGFVTYSNQSKHEMLGVSTDALTYHGAVSMQVVRQMAEGAIKNSRAQVSVAVTGIAGPGGGSDEKPVGTVWIAWAGVDNKTIYIKHQFTGDRHEVRKQTVNAAIVGMIDFVEK